MQCNDVFKKSMQCNSSCNTIFMKIYMVQCDQCQKFILSILLQQKKDVRNLKLKQYKKFTLHIQGCTYTHGEIS